MVKWVNKNNQTNCHVNKLLSCSAGDLSPHSKFSSSSFLSIGFPFPLTHLFMSALTQPASRRNTHTKSGVTPGASYQTYGSLSHASACPTRTTLGDHLPHPNNDSADFRRVFQSQSMNNNYDLTDNQTEMQQSGAGFPKILKLLHGENLKVTFLQGFASIDSRYLIFQYCKIISQSIHMVAVWPGTRFVTQTQGTHGFHETFPA